MMNDFWNKHSEHYLEMAFRTDRCEIITNPDGYGKNTGECGDTIEMFLTVVSERIQWISFATDGCINTRACANTVAEMAEKRAFSRAILKIMGMYEHGVFGEDESESFKKG